MIYLNVGEAATVWTFQTDRLTVSLTIERTAEPYDGDDPDGEIQRAIDSGDYWTFDSTVTVDLDGRQIGSDHLGMSVYDADRVSEFWTAHRDPDPGNRNCTKRAGGGTICHYFPDMVRAAIREARAFLPEN